MKRRRKQSGFVLLLTLFVLALAATAMSSLCLRSLHKAVDSARSVEDLQRKWGTVSCQTVLLPKAEELLADNEQQTGKSTAKVTFILHLGGHADARSTAIVGEQEFDLTFSDEQAKVNANALYRERGKADAEQALTDLIFRTAGSASVRFQLPLNVPEGNRSDLLQCLNQVLPDASAKQLAEGSPQPLVADLTCWGDGKLDFRRASRDALQTRCSQFLGAGEVGELVAMREQTPPLSLSAALDGLQLTRERRKGAEELLMDGSNCHALWIVVKTPQRAWYHLAVAAPGSGDVKQSMSIFEW